MLSLNLQTFINLLLLNSEFLCTLIQSKHQPEHEMSVLDDIMYGQRRDSIYDQVNETQVYNDLVDNTTSSSASAWHILISPHNKLNIDLS